jgi:hypothetical protein
MRAELGPMQKSGKSKCRQYTVRDSACMRARANGQQHLYCSCTVSAGGFANISISSASVRWTVVNENRSRESFH